MAKRFENQIILKSLGVIQRKGSKQDSQNRPMSPVPDGREP